MIIKNKNKLFELSILDYEFSEKLKDKHDLNWLMIEIKVVSGKDSWKRKLPMLLTWEFRELVQWFKNIRDDTFPKEISFVEPYLRFVKIKNKNNNLNLRVYFELEAKRKPSKYVGEKSSFINLTVTKSNITQIIKELTNELNKFPER